MRSAQLIGLISILLLATASNAQQPAAPMMGFAPDRAAEQREREAEFDAKLSAENLRGWMRRLSARPHPVGSFYGHENAQYMAALFREWGYSVRVEEYEVLFPTPKTRLLEMTAPERFAPRLAEPPLPEDSTSGQIDEQLPGYHAYSIDGDVTGEVVYVNYGVPMDYEELERRGISVEGKIALARYGGSWRGIKPKVAAERGAIGCIIYSDPRDDGYFQGDVYPKGAYRMEHGIQRGSVADMPLYPGDPLTPGIGATSDAERLPIAEAPTLTKIPVMPISYADALPILRALEGPVAPESWRGALPITYHLGPGPAIVHLKVEFSWDIVTAFNVIARTEGSERPEQWIVRGNHHDAWVNGAADPISGMVALMEEARAVGELARAGWRPKRTIVYCAWDAEEPGLLGSTEWVERHAAELGDKAAVYINTDGSGRGFLNAGGSHTLEAFINEVARDVRDPQVGGSVFERARARDLVNAAPAEREKIRARRDNPIAALGSGSDYTPFLQHLGIASLNLGFGGESGGGSYHSAYDSFDHYTRFGDPDFQYGVALAQVCGRATMRLADADALPFEFAALAETIGGYVEEVEKLADDMRRETEQTNRLIAEGAFVKAADPTQAGKAPAIRAPVPHLNFAPLENALERLRRAAKDYQAAAERRSGAESSMGVEVRSALDAMLYKTERALTREEGLPVRPWFKHYIYAPGFYTGYGVKTLPAVREAIEQREWSAIDANVQKTAQAICSASVGNGIFGRRG